MTIRADYDSIDWLRGKLAEALTALSTGHDALNGTLSMSSAAFGATDGAGECAAEYQKTAAKGLEAVANLMNTLDADTAKMQRMVDTYRATDQETADGLFSAAGNKLDVYSAHVHSNRDGQPVLQEDQIRAGHIGNLVDAAGSHEGPVVVGADLNADLGGRSNEDASEAAIGRFETELGMNNSGQVGPTSSLGDGRPIDYVFTSGDLETGDPERVHGEPSDHDGQAVAITAPRW